MMKKQLTAFFMAAALSAASLTGCSGSTASNNPAGQETTAPETVKEVSLEDVLSDIKNAYGENYIPNTEMDEQMLKDVIGLSPELCESYVAEAPMISTFVETFIGVQAKDGKGDDVEAALNAYRDRLVGDTMQYPMNIAKIQASQVVRHGDYIFFVMLGAPSDASMEEGDEAALESAAENNQIAIDIIDGYFKEAMVFSSLLFLFRFLPLFLALYFAAPKSLRNGILFFGSLIFYGWGEPVYISLLLFSTLVDFIHGKLVGYFKEKGNLKGARLAVASSAVINLSLLFVFKYTDFVIRSFNELTGSSFPLLGLALPIGISFYTFQTMSYTIDVYRGEAPVQDNLISFGAYVSMFPQLIAGPIVRYQDIAAELNCRRENLEQFSLGIRYFIIGLGKKVLLANQAGALWTEINGILPEERSVLMVWLGILAFSFQIYFDFSGYSDMAVGMGHMLGFRFPENFNYPYISKSITEFWRRWHISLGTWFKEYVYIPLGGNRKGGLLQVRNILIVWLLTGIWHGASLNFLMWGVYFGILLLFEKFILKNILKKLPSWLQHTYACLLVIFGWVLFAFEDLHAGLAYLLQMLGVSGLPFSNDRTLFLLLGSLSLLVFSAFGSTPLPAKLADRFCKKGRTILEPLFLGAVLFLSIAYLVDATYNPFLYFRF